jgi:hypothetical protein
MARRSAGFQFLPYPRGAAPAIQDLVAGQIDTVISDPIAALPQVRAPADAYASSAAIRCSASRIESATIVKVGLEMPVEAKTDEPAT